MPKDQEAIYYVSGETVDRIDLLPQVERVKEKNYDILYLTDYVDEFALQVIGKYKDKEFKNISDANTDFSTEEEKKKLEKLNKDNKDLLDFIKDTLKGEVIDVRLTDKLSKHPVCLTTEGEVSVEMQKVINAMPTDENIKASLVLEINSKHKIVKKLSKLYDEDKKELKKYAQILYSEARLIEGLPIENPTEISSLITELIAK